MSSSVSLANATRVNASESQRCATLSSDVEAEGRSARPEAAAGSPGGSWRRPDVQQQLVVVVVLHKHTQTHKHTHSVWPPAVQMVHSYQFIMELLFRVMKKTWLLPPERTEAKKTLSFLSDRNFSR